MPEDITSLMNSTPTGQHMLLGEALVIPKAASDPTTVTDGVTDGLGKFWVEDGRLYLGIYSKDLGGWTVLGEEPIGIFKPYVGLESDIPRGWHLCDGSNGTVDFRGYFIVGSSLEDAGLLTEATTLTVTDDATNQVTVTDTPASFTSAFIQKVS